MRSQLAVDQNPGYPPVNIRFNPTTRIDSKMEGEFAYQPKWDPLGFDPQLSHVLKTRVDDPVSNPASTSCEYAPSEFFTWFWVSTILVPIGFDCASTEPLGAQAVLLMGPRARAMLEASSFWSVSGREAKRRARFSGFGRAPRKRFPWGGAFLFQNEGGDASGWFGFGFPSPTTKRGSPREKTKRHSQVAFLRTCL